MVDGNYSDSYAEIDLMELLLVLWKRKALIVILAVAAVVAGFVGSKLMSPVYETTLPVRITEPLAQTEFTPKVPTVAEVAHFLRSPSVLQAVHRETGIGDSWESLRGALSVETPSNTNMVVLKAEAGSPEDGVKLVETWFHLATDRYNQSTRRSLAAVVDRLSHELETSQGKLRQYTRAMAGVFQGR